MGVGTEKRSNDKNAGYDGIKDISRIEVRRRASGRKMKEYRLVILCSLVLLSWGCAPTWQLRTEQPDIPLQWPYQPSKAKIGYVKALTGFTPSSSSQSLLRAIVYGKRGSGTDTLNLPVAAVTGRDGRLAIADTGCKCVHLYIPAQEQYIRITRADTGVLTSPVSVIFDDELRLYVSDSEAGQVFIFGNDGTYLSSLRRAGADYLKRPTGLAYNDTKKLLYVVDTSANRIYAFNTQGDVVLSFGGRGEADGSFNFPTHIFRSPSGALYVTDSMNFRIAIFEETGKFLGSFGHHGDGSGDLARPKGVAADKDGTVYVVDSLFDNVQLFDRQGTFLLTVGKRGTDLGEFWLPSGIFIDGSDTLYICDTYNKRVQIFRITGNYGDGKF